MKVWNLNTEKFETLEKWMKYCPWINTRYIDWKIVE